MNLSSRAQTFESMRVLPDLDFQYHDWVASSYALLDIAPHAGLREQEPDFLSLKDSIVRVGMKYPVVLLENSFANYVGCCADVRADCILPHDPSRPFIAASGNQRLAIAKRLQYSTIDCVLAPDLEWAYSIILRGKED